MQGRLRDGHERPEGHLDRDPSVRAESFGDELRGQLGHEEGDVEYDVSGIIVYS